MNTATHHRHLTWVGIAMVALILGSGGCASSSGRVQYTNHISHRIDSAPAANTDIAFSFGLDGLGDQGHAVVRGREE